MDIYWFNPQTREFTCQGTANEDPEEPGRFAIPANASTIAPPQIPAKQAAVLGEQGWSLVPDHRGETWYRGRGEPEVITSLGDPAEDGLFAVEPPAPPPTSAQLVAHANAAQMRKALGGVVLTVAGQQLSFATDGISMAFINGKALAMQLDGGPASANWQVGPTEFVQIAKDDFIPAALAVQDFVQATFDKLPAIFAGINDGSISTFADIDAEFAA